MSFDDDTFQSDLLTRFIEGLHDQEHTVVAERAWQTNSNIYDLFLAIDMFDKKRTLLAGKIPHHTSAVKVDANMVSQEPDSEFEMVEVEEEDGSISAVQFRRNTPRRFVTKKPTSWNSDWKKSSDKFPNKETQSVNDQVVSDGQILTMKDVAYWMKGINATLAQLMKKAVGQDR